jgi:hypothetical protein
MYEIQQDHLDVTNTNVLQSTIIADQFDSISEAESFLRKRGYFYSDAGIWYGKSLQYPIKIIKMRAKNIFDIRTFTK